MQLFAEIFPVHEPPSLAGYTLHFVPAEVPVAVDTTRLGRQLARRLTRSFPGHWLWLDGRLVSDVAPGDVELMIALDLAREDDPERFGWVESLTFDAGWQPGAATIADYVIRTRLSAFDEAMNAALAKFNRTVGGLRLERDFRLAAWDVNGLPAVSISTAARLIHERDAAAYAAEQDDPRAALMDLRVSDRTSSFSGEIIAVTGTIAQRRDKLLKHARTDALVRLIQRAPDDTPTVRVQGGDRRREFPANALEILVRPSDFPRFEVNPDQVNPLLRPDPATRAQWVRLLADIAKEGEALANAYNAREYPALFTLPDEDDQPYLRFADGRTRPYNPDRLAYDLSQCGAYALRKVYADAPIEVAVVNTLSSKLEDFVEALNRALSRSFDFGIEVLRERRVRVISLANLEAAVRVVEKEAPDIILAFLPDEARTQEGEDMLAYVKSLTLGRGIPAHVIFQSTLDDPEAMYEIIMTILARTGNTPYALADALEFTDYVVGLDVVRDPIRDSDKTRLTAISRIYTREGQFLRFVVREAEVAGGELPFVLLRDLFPQRDFQQKRVVIHHDDRMPDDTRQALALWAQALQAKFYTVELIRRGAPRLYAFDEGKIVPPPVGSAFRLNAREAFVVLSVDEDADQRSTPTPQPVHVIAGGGLDIDQALRSIRMWTLLYYGANRAPRLPVTIYGAGELAYWLRKGGVFTETAGELPFWL